MCALFPSVRRRISRPERRGLVGGVGSRQRTSVAEMPGYPTRKLLFGGPETRTLAGVEAMLSSQSQQRDCELSPPLMVLPSLLLLSRGLRMRSRWAEASAAELEAQLRSGEGLGSGASAGAVRSRRRGIRYLWFPQGRVASR